jgi:hypothetical protein
MNGSTIRGPDLIYLIGLLVGVAARVPALVYLDEQHRAEAPFADDGAVGRVVPLWLGWCGSGWVRLGCGLHG